MGIGDTYKSIDFFVLKALNLLELIGSLENLAFPKLGTLKI